MSIDIEKQSNWRAWMATKSPTTSAADEISFLRAQVAKLEADLKHWKTACLKINADVVQTLGQALDYPWFKNDQKNFPGATEADGVCVGDNVPESLADEAASKIKKLEAEALKARKT